MGNCGEPTKRPPAPGTGHTSFEKADKSSRFTDAQLAPFNGTTAGRLPRDCRTAVSTWPTDCLHDRAVPSGSAQQLVQVVRTGLQVTGARQHVQVLGVAQQAGTGEAHRVRLLAYLLQPALDRLRAHAQPVRHLLDLQRGGW